MFKKLKQKISEEQTSPAPRSPSRRVPSSIPEGSSTSSPSTVRSRTSSLVEQNDEGTLTPNKELLAGMIAEPAFLSEYTVFALDPTKRPKPQSGSVNVSKHTTPSTNNRESESSSPQPSDVKLLFQQLRAPSMESLFRIPLKESLFRSSSKESLVRTSSRDSLNKLDFDSPGPVFDPPSDVESETEDLPGNLDSLPKEQLLQRLRRMERSLGSYRGKYSELVTAYQAVQREKKKLQGILSQSQDKALRRIGELREELQMDQQAKKHLQEEFDASLEEKDQLISVLQTQVSLLKERLQNGQISIELPEPNVQTELQVQSPTKDINTENALQSGSPGGDGDSSKTLEALIQRVKRQENLLHRCKETIRLHKERSAQLTNEKEALQEQLDERLQELEKMKDLHMAEKTKLITQLRDAKNLIEQLEQDKGMVIAETKRQMHETLEMKEEEIAQLRAHLKQIVMQSEELKEQKEKSEKAAFEELEKALSTAQRTEEARKKLQAEMDDKIEAIEKTSEEERVSLQQELTRVKQEVVNIMKKSSEEQVTELEKLHKSELASKEQMSNDRLRAQDQAFQEQMKMALEKCKREHLHILKEKEHQESLALEELELQKKAIQLESDKKLEDMQQEVETFRTRILELESSLAKCSHNDKNQLEELTPQAESEKNKHNKEITAMVENHKEELEKVKQKQEQLWTKKFDTLIQQQHLEIENLKRQHEEELAKILKEKESVFHAHIEEMNEKTLEKLDMKQTELEALSSELSEALKIRQDLERDLSTLKNDADKAEQEFETKLEQQRNHHKEQVEVIFKDQGSLERTYREKIHQLGLLLEAKEKCQEELEVQLRMLKESFIKAESEHKEKSAELNVLCQSSKDSAKEQTSIYEQNLADLQQILADEKADKSHLEEQIVKTESQLNVVKTELDSQISQVHDLKCEQEKQKGEHLQKITSLTEHYESQLRDLREEIDQAKRCFTDKENELEQTKGLLNQQIDKLEQNLSAKEEEINALKGDYENKLKHQERQTEKVKEKAKEMQEKFKNKISEQEAKLKKEIENKQLELCQKEKQFNSQILEMAHASSAGIGDAVSKLEMSQKEQLERLAETHRQELEQVVQTWERKLSQQAEELREKHEMELQEKEQEVGDLKHKLVTFSAEREGNSAEITRLKDEQAKKDESLNELQEQLQQSLAQVTVLTQKETGLKTQLKKLEEDLSLSLKEKLAVQEQLSEITAVGEKEKNKISELADKLKTSDEHLQALESSHSKEREDYEKKIKDKNLELQQKTAEFETFARDVARQLEDYQQKTEALLHTKTTELTEKCNERISLINARVVHCHHQAKKIKEAMLIKTCKIPDLETQLKQVTESHGTLTGCLQESKQQLQEKENLMMSMKMDIERLVTEKEQLQKEGGHQQQAATEKETCITQLKKELSENINVVTSLREELKEKYSEIVDLNKLVGELNLKVENGISEKDAATTLLNKQHKENQLQLLNEVQELTSRVGTLSEEKAAALEQVDHWMNKLSEWKKKAQLRFTQNHNTIKELQNKVELSNNQAGEKEEELNRMKEEFDKQAKHLEHLKDLIEQKQIRREKQESDLTAELKIQTARIAELEEHIARKTTENDSLMEELKKHNEWKQAEQNKLAQQLQQDEVVIVEKDNRLKEMEQKVLTLEKQMQTMEADLKVKSRELEETKVALMKSKEEELKALEGRLISENTTKITDLKKKAEQKIAAVRKQLTSQMEEREQQYRHDMGKQLVDLEQKLQDKENKIISLEEKIRSAEELEKMTQKVEAIKVSTEQDKVHALENMQQMYELKIDALQKELLVKEKELQVYNEQQQKSDASKLEAQIQQDELLQKKQEDLLIIQTLRQDLEEQIKKHASLLEQYTKDASDLASIKGELKTKEQKQQEMENVIEDLKTKLQEKEKDWQSLQQQMNSSDENLTKQRELHKTEMGKMISTYGDKLQRLQQQLDERSGLLKALEESTEEKTRSGLELQKQLGDLQIQHKDLQAKLEETEQEKQKLCKDLSKLQKDLRTLRKEHQQELEIMKKESLEEMEQKIKCEQEDTELKHNSTLKQLMREFNTQLAQKDRELETAIKETIGKAQEVEAELIESHHAEITQLHKKILEKDDDLQRTVKKYEEILETREEEMTEKVNELQKQLEKLQEEYKQRLADEESWNSGEVTIEELQAQLAQKTTIVNDSKLKEQEFREQIHTLQDRLKHYEKSMYVTTVGTPYRDGNLCHSDVSLFGEPTEFEYLRKVLFEYMMGRETKTMAKVITTVLKFPADQTQKILEREDARTLLTSPRSGIF
ncbi:golgin subfamily A member 4 isoform X2 [Hemicordylus capensis]|uniref:golgin subfamily A member 4 isoform X2 n=1 Tax=Hemicordylus capensis TaxID=884348 RepID=UPI002302289F|nr:golgin subfamily A member 4 isoform X2 [Hemicordylus capensis]